MMNTEQKIARMERQLQRQQWMIYTLLFVMGGGLLMGFKSQLNDVEPIVKAHKFELVNTQGKTLMVIEPKETAGGLSIYNQNGREMIGFGADQSGTGGLLELMGNDGALMQLRTTADGSAMKLYDKKKHNLVFLGQDKQHPESGFLKLNRIDTAAVMLNAHEGKLYLSNPKSKTGYSMLPQ